MKKFLIVILIFIASGYSLFSQITFQRDYDMGGTFDFFSSALQTSDNGFLMTGYKIDLAAYSIDLVKTDTAGSVQWAKEYHSGNILLPYADVYTSSKIIQTSEGGYMICGSREGDFFLLKLDVGGNISWGKNYNLASEDNLYSVKQTSDGGYIAVGSTRLSSNDSLDAYIFKVNSSGSFQWGARWSNGSFNSDDVLYDVEEEPGVGYIGVGYTSQVFNGNDTTLDILVLKTDLSGNITYGKALGADGDDDEAKYILRDGTDFYLTGYTEYNAFGTDAYFLKMNSSATASLVKSYDIGLTDMGGKLIKQSNGNYAIFGMDVMNFNVFMLNVNSTGTFQNGYSYTGNSSFPIVVDGQQTSDGGFMLGTMAGNYNYTLIKTNSAGNSNCLESAISTSTSTITLPLTSCTNVYAAGGSGGSPTVSVDNFTLSDTTIHCIEVPCDTPTVSVNPTSATICDNENQTIVATSPTATSYSWSSGQGTSSIVVSPNSTSTYTVTAYYGICPSHPTSVTVNVNASPNVSISGNTSICEGKYTTLTASGANSYAWDTGANTPAITVFPTSDSLFTVIGYNANCSDTVSQLVTVGLNPVISISGDTTICYGQSTILTASGTNGADTYSWSNGGGTNASTNVSPQLQTTYWVTVTNSTTTCYDSSDVTVYVNQLPTITFSGDTSLCIGDTTVLTASGGDAYLWSTTSVYDTTNVAPVSNSQYSVTVTNNTTTCSNVDTIDVYVHPLPIAVANGDTTVCQGMPVQISATGGSTYSWSPTASLDTSTISNPIATPQSTTTYSVTVTSVYGCTDVDSVKVNINQAPQFTLDSDSTLCFGDANGSANVNISQSQYYSFNWSNGDTTTSISNLISGIYSITVTDSIGCYAVGNINVYQPNNFTDSINLQNVSCYGNNDGEISIFVSGGTPQYHYLWSNSQTTQTINNLSPGAYDVTVNDKNNCSFSVSNIQINEPSKILVSSSNTDILCYGDSSSNITITASGGTGDLSYLINNQLSESTTQNLPAGTYYIEVKDSNSCSVYDTITISQPNEININDSLYYQSYEGNILVEATGGTSPYTYEWSTGGTQNIISNLSAGNYYLTLTDANNCYLKDSFIIDIPLIIPLAITPNNDGYNDTWNIVGIEAYSTVNIEIYNRWGDEVFIFNGSGYEYMSKENQWDGTFNGKQLPVAGYIFIITLNNDIVKTGPVTIIR